MKAMSHPTTFCLGKHGTAQGSFGESFRQAFGAGHDFQHPRKINTHRDSSPFMFEFMKKQKSTHQLSGVGGYEAASSAKILLGEWEWGGVGGARSHELELRLKGRRPRDVGG